MLNGGFGYIAPKYSTVSTIFPRNGSFSTRTTPLPAHPPGTQAPTRSAGSMWTTSSLLYMERKKRWNPRRSASCTLRSIRQTALHSPHNPISAKNASLLYWMALPRGWAAGSLRSLIFGAQPSFHQPNAQEHPGDDEDQCIVADPGPSRVFIDDQQDDGDQDDGQCR